MTTPTSLASALALFAACVSCNSGPGFSNVHGGTLASSTSSALGRPMLVGVWKVTKFCDDDDAGRLYDPLGPNPTGYFVYSASGQLSIQAMRTPAMKPFAEGDEKPSDVELREQHDAYFGYYGTYTITSESTVVHHVLGGTVPSYIGTDQARVYRIRGDTLAIGGSRRTWPCRVLIRVE